MSTLALAGVEAMATGTVAGGAAAWWDRVGRTRHPEQSTSDTAPLLARVALAVALGLIGWAATAWPVAGMWAGLGGWALPGLRRADRSRSGVADLLDAWASWVGLITGQLAAQASLAEALLGACERAPGALADQIAPLRRELAYLPLDDAIATWAVEGSASAELRQVAMVLSLAAGGSGGRVVEVLGGLGSQLRARAASARRIERERRRTRVAGRASAGVAVVWLVLGARVDTALFGVYRGFIGQCLLGLLLGMVAAGLWGLARLDRGLA